MLSCGDTEFIKRLRKPVYLLRVGVEACFVFGRLLDDELTFLQEIDALLQVGDFPFKPFLFGQSVSAHTPLTTLPLPRSASVSATTSFNSDPRVRIT